MTTHWYGAYVQNLWQASRKLDRYTQLFHVGEVGGT